MVAGHRVLAEQLGELGGDALRHLARVHEDEGGAVRAHQLRHALVDLGPLLVRAHRAQRRGRDLDAEVEVAERARVHEVARASGAGQESRHVFQRLLGGGKPDALQRLAGQRLQALQREREMRAALVPHEGMDLVHDHAAHGREHPAAAVAGQQEVQRFRRRDQDVRRPLGHRRALALWRVARSHLHAHLGQALVGGADLGQGTLKVLLDVVGQGTQRRDVEDVRFVGELTPPLQQRVDRGEERGQGLARARGRGDQDVAALADEGPAFALGRGRLAETIGEPALHGGVESGQRGHETGTRIEGNRSLLRSPPASGPIFLAHQAETAASSAA